MPTSLSVLWQLNLIPLGSFRVLMPIFLNSAATKPGHLDHSGLSCRLFLNSAATKPGHLKTIPGSHADCFSILRQLNLVTSRPFRVLMPIVFPFCGN